MHIGQKQALIALRALLAELRVPESMAHRTHDFRRGHAEDIRLAGGRLCEILEAGDWCSKAFMFYLNRERCGIALWVLTSMVMRAHFGRLESARVEEAHVGFSQGGQSPPGWTR